MRHCPIRNYYIFDIPKKKFPSRKKLMYFSFIVDGYKIVDPSYSYKNFGQEYVNIVDFNITEKRQQKLLVKYSNILKNTCWINSITPYGDKDDISEINYSKSNKNNLRNINNLNNSAISFRGGENLSLSLNQSASTLNRYFKNKEHDALVNSTIESSTNMDCLSASVNEEIFKCNSKKIKRNKSILKEHKKDLSLSGSSSSKNKVSFGNVQFTYYCDK